jgi:hypothetical protein
MFLGLGIVIFRTLFDGTSLNDQAYGKLSSKIDRCKAFVEFPRTDTEGAALMFT